MKLLVVHWGAYTHLDIIQAFAKMQIHTKVMDYGFQDKNQDEVFEAWLTSELNEIAYDAVFTVNYFPVIAKVCGKCGRKYLSWSYDCPLNVYDIEDTLGLPTNYVFLFDRIQVKTYRARGFTNVYHLPLGISSERLKGIAVTREELPFYEADIAFVGKLYQSMLPIIAAGMDDYTRGYLNAIAEMQRKVYGAFFAENLLTKELLTNINRQLTDTSWQYGVISREQFLYALATYITYKERVMLLKQLSERHHLKLYSGEASHELDKVIYQGRVSYLNEMPKVFAASKINLNITVKNTQSGMPLRVLDIMGCGGFLLSNYQPELVEFFVPDVDFVYYESIEDALEKADFYLHHESERKKIAANGCQKCHEQFDYEQQLSKLFYLSNI